MARKVKLTAPQRAALLEYGDIVRGPYISPVTTYWLNAKNLIEKDPKGKWVLTHKGLCAVDSGYLPA